MNATDMGAWVIAATACFLMLLLIVHDWQERRAAKERRQRHDRKY